MPVLSRNDILSKKSEIRTEVVSVPEWGGEVMIREMLADEAEAFELKTLKARESGDKIAFRVGIVALCAIDENGHRLFTDKDVEELGQLSRKALERVADAARKLSGYNADTTETLKKTSKESDSSSDSPLPSAERLAS